MVPVLGGISACLRRVALCYLGQVLQQIAYSNPNDNPPANVQLDVTINDGNTVGGPQGSGGPLSATGMVNVIIVFDAQFAWQVLLSTSVSRATLLARTNFVQLANIAVLMVSNM